MTVEQKLRTAWTETRPFPEVRAGALGVRIAALGKGAAGCEQEKEPGDGEVAQDRVLDHVLG